LKNKDIINVLVWVCWIHRWC